jgi:hypothetical protein
LAATQVPEAPRFIGGYEVFEAPVMTVLGASFFDVEESLGVFRIGDVDRICFRHTHGEENPYERNDKGDWPHGITILAGVVI